MTIKISKRNILDNAILIILLLNVAIIRWLGYQSTINDIIMFLVCLDLVLYRNKLSGNIIFSLVMLALYLVFQFLLFSGSYNLFIWNAYKTIRGLLIIVFISRLISRKPDFTENWFKKLVVPANLYLLINIPFLLLQSNGMISLAARDISSSVTHITVDYYSGLFGLYGTPCLAAYCTFLFIYNSIYIKNYAQKRNKSRLAILNIFFLVFFLVFSVINDNKFFYIEIVMFSLIAYIALYEKTNVEVLYGDDAQRKKNKNVWTRLILILVVIAVVFELAYQNSTQFHSLVDLFIGKINEGFDYTNVRGGGERIGTVLYMLNSRSILFGYGLAKLRIESGTLGFAHLGSADLGVIFSLGGVIYVLLVFTVIFYCFKNTFPRSRVALLLTIAFFVMALYTNAFNNTSTTTSLVLIYLSCWVATLPKYRITRPSERNL